MSVLTFAEADMSQKKIVMTLGADLSAEQKAYVLQYFGISESDVEVIIVTNADERAHLEGLIPSEVIGTHTYSCALVRPTSSGGIQAKIANMNYVTGNTIASNLTTSGVYNCEVLAVAPFEVSGTGALTGVLMAYETASGEVLDVEKKELANEELVLTGEIAETVGQDQATLVVNDIKIHIVRDQITDQESVVQVVDEVIATTETAAAEAASAAGMNAPATLGQVEHEKLYNFGYKFSQMGYRYKDMQPTLERVTHNVTQSTGIKDPIVDTFTTIQEDSSLSADSILLNTDDEALGENVIINATNSAVIGDHEPEPIEVYTGDVTLTAAGGVKAAGFVTHTDVVSYRDVNGSYALMDLNGNILTDSIYKDEFRGFYGNITGILDDGSGKRGVFASDGMVVVPFTYDVVSVPGAMWAIGIELVPGTEEDYDYYTFSQYYQIGTADIYFISSEGGKLVASLSRDQIADGYCYKDYINIRDRSGNITLYDSQFRALQNTESLYDFSFNEDYTLARSLSDATGYYVNEFKGGYASFSDGSGAYGIMDRYGNVIIPAEYERFYAEYTDENEYFYPAEGYFTAEKNDCLTYVTAGGAVTGSFSYLKSDLYGYGACSLYKNDGKLILLSGDGKETDFTGIYQELRVIYESKGLLWKARKENGKLDLVDWHGNVLVSDSTEYSMSANGNYVIAQNGYTSSTLYLVDDASPIRITESMGGATELEVEIQEAASLDTYNKDTAIEKLGTISGSNFVDSTNLVLATNDNEHYALLDLKGNQLTNPDYTRSFEYQKGLVISEKQDGDRRICGIFTPEGQELIPCTYDVVKVLDEHWVAGYDLTDDGTEEDCDFKDYNGGYYRISQAVIAHISDTEISSVTLTRDQIAEVEAHGEYLNVRDRTTGNVTTYDASFQAVKSVSNISDFKEFSSEYVLSKQLSDSTGYSVSEQFADGYTIITDHSGEGYPEGIIDVSGNIIVPPVYDRILNYYYNGKNRYNIEGYFGVKKDDLVGYVSNGGTVTCELKYPYEDFTFQGIAGSLKKKDGTYMLVAADGTETDGFSSLNGYAKGKIWKGIRADNDELVLTDWHGNVLMKDFAYVDVSGDGNYLIVQKDYKSVPELYGIDGANLEQVSDPGRLPQEQPEQEEADRLPQEQPEQEEADPQEADTIQNEQDAVQEDAGDVFDTASEDKTGDASAAPSEGTASANPAEGLLDSACQLISSDITANQDSIVILLGQAEALLEESDPSAAALIKSAVTLVSSGSTDKESVLKLIETARGY